MRFRRIRLFVREDRKTGRYSVGYWDRKVTPDPDRDFRSFGVGLTAQEALDIADRIIAKRPKEFFRD